MPNGFTSPPEPEKFNQMVWEIVRQIPLGRVATYGQIASLAAAPEGLPIKDYLAWGARWVGGAMAACPVDVPWQRVINAQGKISLRKEAGGQRQRELLAAEGILFDEKDRIDLAVYGWQPAGQEDQPGDQQNAARLF